MELLIGFFMFGLVITLAIMVFNILSVFVMMIVMGVIGALGYVWDKIRGNND